MRQETITAHSKDRSERVDLTFKTYEHVEEAMQLLGPKATLDLINDGIRRKYRNEAMNKVMLKVSDRKKSS